MRFVNRYPNNVSSIGKITECVENALKEKRISKKLINEYNLLIEEIIVKLIDVSKPDSAIVLEINSRLGGISIKISSAGSPVILSTGDESDIGGMIISQFSDYINQGYFNGVNTVTFSTSSSSNDMVLRNAVSYVVAAVLSLILILALSDAQLTWLNDNVFFPCITIFSKCMQTMVIPTAFFSLAAFVISMHATLDLDRSVLSVILRYIFTTLIAIGLGVLVWFAAGSLGVFDGFIISKTDGVDILGNTLGSIIVNAVPSNIIEPFTLTSPLPMLLIALLTGFAASRSFGPTGDRAKNAIDTVSNLFGKIINCIYDLSPLFLFFSMLYIWTANGFSYARILCVEVLIFVPALLGMCLVYMLMLTVGGVNPFHFIKYYKDVILENFKIASNIASIPYNSRELCRRTKLSKSTVKSQLQLGATMNMDGNAVMISLGILMMVSVTGTQITFFQGATLAVIIILLSIGAPNQPGSFFLSMVVLMEYLGISSVACADILMIEVLFTKFYSSINSFGDIVNIVTYDKRRNIQKKRSAKQSSVT